MKKLLTTAFAAASFLLTTATFTTPASASVVDWDENGCVSLPFIGKICPPPVEVDCEQCTDTALSLKQFAFGWQKAFNNAYDVDYANNVTQEALNALNLINLDGLNDSGDVEVAVGPADQFAIGFQTADNDFVGIDNSDINDLVQSATNLMNSISGSALTWAEQDAIGNQDASNYLEFGAGGYDGVLVNGELEDPTQSATNLANLIDVAALTGGIQQDADVSQTAINTAAYDTDYGYMIFKGHFALDANVADFEQTATNVANLITVGAIDPLSCDCLENLGLDAQIMQKADVNQFASNDLFSYGFGEIDLTNITQTATNIANSIGMQASTGTGDGEGEED